MTDASAPLVALTALSKLYDGPDPLRIDRLVLRASDRASLFGLSKGGSEMLIHLITGASVPEEGTVTIAGTNTRDIKTDTEWLSSLDRFGLVTNRAVLIEKLPVAANIALPLTLAIDPMTEATRAQVEALADVVQLPRLRLDAPASTLSAFERMVVHLARALAMDPQMLLLEQPTAEFRETPASAAFGKILASMGERRRVGWLALTDDRPFARASGARQWSVDASGHVSAVSAWRRLLG